VLWGESGTVNRCFHPLDDWRRVAQDFSGGTLPCGHYIPEEVPDALLREMLAFF
jgi:haloacetate dehalogenase